MHKTVNVLITGSNGVVGSYIPQIFSNDKYNLHLTTRQSLDVTDKKRVFDVFHSFRPDFVIHLAAKTNVDMCEKNPFDTFKVNTKGTINIVLACRFYKATLAFVSTAGVFDGSRSGFYENDRPSPLSVYGKSKYKAEKAIQKLLKNYFIVRAGWMIGGVKREKKFISYVFDKIKKGERVNAVSDTLGTLTYAKELVVIIKKLYEKNYPYGTYHFGSREICSRYDIAKEISKIVKSDSAIIPVSWKDFSDKFFAPRPKNEILKSRRLYSLKNWKESLNEYIKNELL